MATDDGYLEVHDPRTLRAIAHPVRTRILGEITAAGHLRAADVAERLGIPANQASFHLRQLAKYGLVVQAPELARDGRDRVWKPASERGVTVEIEDMEIEPGGKAAATVFRRQAAASAKAAIDRAYTSTKQRETHVMISDVWLRLSKAEAKQLSDDLLEVQERWMDRTRDAPTRGSRRTYHLLQVLQPGPQVGS